MMVRTFTDKNSSWQMWQMNMCFSIGILFFKTSIFTCHACPKQASPHKGGENLCDYSIFSAAQGFTHKFAKVLRVIGKKFYYLSGWLLTQFSTIRF
jgi:hypothetical protein